MSKTDGLDPNVPAQSESPKLGARRIRELARAVAELLNVDHYIGSDGGAGTGYNEDDTGEHKKVTLRVASAPTVESNKGYVYAKDVGGKAELFYKDEDGNEIQITAGGILNSCNLAGDQTVAGVKTLSSRPSLPNGLTAAKALISTLATGTAPLTVASTTKVANLNADKVDGYDIAAYTGGQSHTFPGGLIMKFGKRGSISANSTATVTYGTAFPTGVVAVFGSFGGTSLTGGSGGAVPTGTPKATLYVRNDSDATEDMYWLAIGY